MFHHISKHLEVRQKYSAARRIVNSLLSVWECDETLSRVFDILLTTTTAISIVLLHYQYHYCLEYLHGTLLFQIIAITIEEMFLLTQASFYQKIKLLSS